MCNTGGIHSIAIGHTTLNNISRENMYDKERCGDCKNKLRCLTGEQWLCTEHSKDYIINTNVNSYNTTLAIDGDVKIRGRSLEDIIDERIANSKFSWRKLWRNLIS